MPQQLAEGRDPTIPWASLPHVDHKLIIFKITSISLRAYVHVLAYHKACVKDTLHWFSPPIVWVPEKELGWSDLADLPGSLFTS